MGERIRAFSWFGGKYMHLSWLLPLLPECHTYVEPFGGSGAVLLNRSPSPVEVWNDIDGHLVNFFRVLREKPEELIAQLQMTLYSREEYVVALALLEDGGESLERARAFYVTVKQSLFSIPGEKWSYSIEDNKGRGGFSPNVMAWMDRVSGLSDVAHRISNVQIEHMDAIKVIKRYDRPGTLFYCDPEYYDIKARSVGQYRHNFQAWQHIELAEVLRRAEGRVAIGNYENEFYTNLYGGWRISKEKPKMPPSVARSGGKNLLQRQEVLWMNYDEQGRKFT